MVDTLPYSANTKPSENEEETQRKVGKREKDYRVNKNLPYFCVCLLSIHQPPPFVTPLLPFFPMTTLPSPFTIASIRKKMRAGVVYVCEDREPSAGGPP